MTVAHVQQFPITQPALLAQTPQYFNILSTVFNSFSTVFYHSTTKQCVVTSTTPYLADRMLQHTVCTLQLSKHVR